MYALTPALTDDDMNTPLIEPLFILPSQFNLDDPEPPLHVRGERALLWATFFDAILIYTYRRRYNDPYSLPDTEAWIESDDEHFLSFRYLCLLFDFDYVAVREALIKQRVVALTEPHKNGRNSLRRFHIESRKGRCIS